MDLLNKMNSDTITIRKNIIEQAFNNCINGLIKEFKFEVKTKNPNTLEKAIIVAALAEIEIKMYNEVHNPLRSNKFNPTKIIFCLIILIAIIFRQHNRYYTLYNVNLM